MYSKLSHHVQMFEKIRHIELSMFDINKLLEMIILDRNPNTNILNNSPNDLIFKFTNISLALLRQGNPIKRRKLLL